MRWIILILSVSLVTAYCETGADSEISQFGITWTFDQEYECGQFVNGDYWVVGPVSIIDINPGHTVVNGRHMHGSMIDPSTSTQGYDSYQYYDEAYNVGIGVSVSNPLTISGDKSLVSTISNDVPGTSQHVSYVQNASILTVLSSTPAADSLRPGYSSTVKTLHRFGEIDTGILDNLPYPTDFDRLDINTYADYLEMVWLAHNGGWTCRYMRPSGSGLHNYYYSQTFSTAALLLNLDYSPAEKERLLINYMQLGIDLYSYLETGASGWPPDGGHASARKLPILLTGMLLDYAPMRNIGARSGDYLYANGHGSGDAPDDYIHFGEDGQTFHVAQSDIDITNSDQWQPDTRNSDYSPYSQAMLGMPEWGIRYSTNQQISDSSWTATYRTIGTGGRAWVGSTMAARIAGAKELWNHDALFDYVDRFSAIAQGQADPFGYTVSNEQPGAWPGGLIGAMYNEYREDYGCMPQGHDAQGLQYDCNENLEQPIENVYYVREGATGDGSDWANALPQLPPSLARGFTYYIATGTYPAYNFDDSGSGSITIKKATASDHGTDTGWQNSYGDGQAVFGPLIFNSDNIVIDGSYEFGLRIVGEYQGLVADVNSNYVTIKHTELDGNFQTSNSRHSGGACNIMNIDGGNVLIENCDIRNAADDGVGIYGTDITLRNNKVHQLHGCGTDGGCGPCYNGHSDGLELHNTENVLLDSNIIYDIQSTSALITGQWSAGLFIRNLEMYNNILYTPDTGITAYISHVHGAKIYNNVFWGRTQGTRYGGLSFGPETTDINMYNNIILNINFNHLSSNYNPSQHHFGNNLYAMINTGEYTIQSNEIIANPEFVGIVESSDMGDHITSALQREDFMLQSGSPAIGTGISNQNTPAIDMFGNYRDSQPDIGVHEIGACTAMTITQLISRINEWKAGQRNIQQVMNSIQQWKSGC